MNKKWLSAPYLVWAVGFIIIPLLMIFWYGFTDRSGSFTMENVLAILTHEHAKALWLSILLSLVSTVICLILAYPLAMILNKHQVNQSSFMVLLFILPMWMNFLLRTLAWQTLLEKNGVINNILSFLHLPALEIINTPTTYREVIVPELGLYCRRRYTPKLLKVYDTVANNAVPDPNWERPAKIYYSRSQFKKGMPFESGFDTLDDFFRRNGYTILYPEKVPLGRMISYIRNADVVASLSGSLPHNMLFARPGQKLEIVERLTINVDNQVGINRIMDLDVTYIDAHIPIYPVDFAGPIIMGYTDCLQRFAADRGYQPPDGRFLTEKHYRKCFIKYMKAYEDLYNYNWFMFDWYAPLTESLIEGFRAGQTYFGDYLNRRKPFRWYHYLEFHYWKQFIKRLIKR